MKSGKKEMNICVAVKNNCWNLFDSYGEICVHCGCCAKDPIERTKSRIEVTKEHLQYWEKMLGDKYIEDKQIKNNYKRDIAYCKKRLRYYEKRLMELKHED